MSSTKNKQPDLTPEQKEALEFLVSNLERIKSIKILEKHTKEDLQVFKQYKIKLSSIPSGSFWHWNQTKQKQDVNIDQHNIEVQFRKLIPRKKCVQDQRELPNLRLWHFTLIDANTEIPTHVLWYQRGYDRIETEKEQQPLVLENYSFLADFMQPADAEYFWPSTQ